MLHFFSTAVIQLVKQFRKDFTLRQLYDQQVSNANIHHRRNYTLCCSKIKALHHNVISFLYFLNIDRYMTFSLELVIEAISSSSTSFVSSGQVREFCLNQVGTFGHSFSSKCESDISCTNSWKRDCAFHMSPVVYKKLKQLFPDSVDYE